MVQQPVLHLSTPHHTARLDHPKVVKFEGAMGRSRALEGVEHRAGEGVSDDGDRIGTLLFGHPPQMVSVEPVSSEGDDRSAEQVCVDRAEPHPGTVHEWAGGNTDPTGTVLGMGSGKGEDVTRRCRRRPSSVRIATAEHAVHEVAHSEHDALGHARRTAGEQHVHLVRAACAARCGVGGDRVGPPRGTGDKAGRARHHVLGHLHHHTQLREPIRNPCDPVGQRIVEEERFDVGILEQIGELVVEVAVVHVHRDSSALERGVLRGQVLVRVVEEQSDFLIGADLVRLQEPGDAGCSIVVLAPDHPLGTVHYCVGVAECIGHRLEHRGEMQLGRSQIHRARRY